MQMVFPTDTVATFLAPMQDITDEGFMRAIAERGAPDFFCAEYFRIHPYFEFAPHVLRTVLSRPKGKMVVAQFIGEDETLILRALEELKQYPEIKMLDLNLGCPAPKICKKNVGGGLLRDVKKIRSISQIMRENWDGIFSIKMRLGFENSDNFEELFKTVLEASPDYITIHARTVKQLYRGSPDYSKIVWAVRNSPVPIVANGDITTAQKAKDIINESKCAGIMIGRHAVRNPWIFRQVREILSGEDVFCPTLLDVRTYVDDLLRFIISGERPVKFPDSCLKKLLNFIAVGVDSKGEFLYEMRRAPNLDALLSVCDKHLTGAENSQKLFKCDGYEGLCSRPNHEL